LTAGRKCTIRERWPNILAYVRKVEGCTMSLEFIEFVLGFEEVFGVELTDAELQPINTPAALTDLIWGKIPHGADTGCLSQKAFNRLRRVICRTANINRRLIAPNVLFADILSSSADYQLAQNVLAREFDADDFPKLARRRNLLCLSIVGLGIRTVAQATRFVVAERPFRLKSNSDGWSRREVGEVVKTRAEEELGV